MLTPRERLLAAVAAIPEDQLRGGGLPPCTISTAADPAAADDLRVHFDFRVCMGVKVYPEDSADEMRVILLAGLQAARRLVGRVIQEGAAP